MEGSPFEATQIEVRISGHYLTPFSHPRRHSVRDPRMLLPTISAGLIAYFDRALGANLLYRFERPQYAEIRRQFVTGPKVVVGQELEMSAVYGAEHLLRMLGGSALGPIVHFTDCCGSVDAKHGRKLEHGSGKRGPRP